MQIILALVVLSLLLWTRSIQFGPRSLWYPSIHTAAGMGGYYN